MRVRIRYKDKDHLDFDQTLTPAGARTVRNRMTVKRFGITVAQRRRNDPQAGLTDTDLLRKGADIAARLRYGARRYRSQTDGHWRFAAPFSSSVAALSYEGPAFATGHEKEC